ncbi:unnamed protein product [Pseudo-nitzschia multistriata]|uniref:Phytanoyl-CoA dioxygenase n=1 Tax=Pseudo-nitzschia multistriata TaxID=183589 RepID=A0A448YWV1_9STRA|nr:unnamed protein product [Pseudo-nitzschia multistriata]
MSASSKVDCEKEADRIDLASLLTDNKRRVDPDAWMAICPGLSIDLSTPSASGSISRKKSHVCSKKSQTKHKRRREKLIRNGYALVNDSFDVRMVREGIEALHKQHLPATFILLFDESWHLACQSKEVLENASHEKNAFNYDLLAWYIPPGSPGFSPHRDRQPDDAPSTFHSDDQQAKFVTNWIALSDATPENSCLYVIPKPFDPGYTNGDIEKVEDDNESSDAVGGNQITNPLHRALSTKESFQHIRCLPRKAGQSVLFTHRIIHWGSQGDPDSGHEDDDDDGGPSRTSTTASSPRIAISFVASDPDYEAPLLVNHSKYFSSTSTTNDDSDTTVRFPPLHIRLLLVCAQLLIYYQRFDIDKSVIKACYNFCKQHEEELEETYRRKVYVEFVNAMKEQKAQGALENPDRKDKKIFSTNPATAAPTTAKSTSNLHVEIKGTLGDGIIQGDDDDDDDDDEDAMLEEMLNAEEGGYGEFEDDYDEMEGGVELENDDEEDSDDEKEGNFDLFGGGREIDDVASPLKKKAKTSNTL